MSAPAAILSLLHEAAGAGHNSATRLFHGQPVLAWTLRRLSRAQRVGNSAILCWDDQVPAVESAAGDCGVLVIPKGPRQTLPTIDAISTSRRWFDGWRGGLLGATSFDAGFHGPWLEAARRQIAADSLLLIDPSSALVDPALVDGLVAHADAHSSSEYCFTPAAPGLCGLLLRAPILQRLAAMNAFPGRLLNYSPDTPGRDPISRDQCAPVPAPLARTTHRFTLDSRRQVQRFECVTADLNGQLIAASSDSLLSRLTARTAEPFPRDLVLELNTTRRSRPIHWPGASLAISRPDFSLAQAHTLFAELGQWDDLRLTLCGLGDALLHPQIFEIIDAARAAGIQAIHLETDLLDVPADHLQRLAESPLDVISVQLPAVTASTYHQVMGVDGLPQVIANLRLFFDHLQKLGRAIPLLSPTFVKLRANLHEMEAWYDHWLRSVGCAVIAAPTDYAGQIPDLAAVDMSPPARRPCQRLATRLAILSDGRIVPCENDILGASALGTVGHNTIEEVWQTSMAELRIAHAAARWNCNALCHNCRDWHRP